MPVALTNQPVFYQRFTPSTRSDMIETINLIMIAAGWTSTPVTGGYQLLGVSPQSLSIYLYVRDKGHAFGSNPYVTFNFETTDGTIEGMDHEIGIGPGTTFQILCGSCYMYLSIPGGTYSQDGGSFCGGIPIFPNSIACGGVIPAIDGPSQSFWAMSDSFGGASPRWSLILSGDQNNCEALWGTNYCSPGSRVGSVRIPALCHGVSPGNGFNLPSPVRWWNGDYITMEPFLAWGIASDVPAVIRGQIPDAMIFSWIKPADFYTTRFGFRWMNYTHNWNYGGLNVITVRAGSDRKGNYAAIAT